MGYDLRESLVREQWRAKTGAENEHPATPAAAEFELAANRSQRQ